MRAVQLFAHLDAYAPLLKELCGVGSAVGLPLAFAGAGLGGSGSPRSPSLFGLLEMIVESIATPLLSRIRLSFAAFGPAEWLWGIRLPSSLSARRPLAVTPGSDLDLLI